MKLTELSNRARRGWQMTTGALQNGLAAFGLLVLVFLAFDAGRFVPIHAAQAGGMAFGKMAKADIPPADIPTLEVAVREEPAPDPRQRTLASHLARKYRVAAAATERLVGEAFAAAAATGVDPLLILAVMAVESSMNPIAESDFGAKGLMQVVPRFHPEKLASHGGEEAVLEPRVNILVGAQILNEYIRRMGDVEAGLQFYAGASDDSERAYARKVLGEMQRLKQAVARGSRVDTQA
jgi:soluble lytic murein transglycosylase-like protein